MKNFKVLMSSGIIVDEKHLGRGIYEAAVPVLRPMTDTMNSIVQKLVASPVRHESTDAVLRNLSLCTLEEVSLSGFVSEVLPAENLVGEDLTGPITPAEEYLLRKEVDRKKRLAELEPKEIVLRETSQAQEDETLKEQLKDWNPDMPLEEFPSGGKSTKTEEE